MHSTNPGEQAAKLDVMLRTSCKPLAKQRLLLSCLQLYKENHVLIDNPFIGLSSVARHDMQWLLPGKDAKLGTIQRIDQHIIDHPFAFGVQVLTGDLPQT